MNNNDNFIVVPMRNVKEGELFLPIERTGEPVYVVKKRRWERAWQKAGRSYVCTGKCRGIDGSGNDGIFSLFDWAVVRRPGQDRVTYPRASDMADKLRTAFRGSYK